MEKNKGKEVYQVLYDVNNNNNSNIKVEGRKKVVYFQSLTQQCGEIEKKTL